jgi:hypothetical protein
MRADIVPGALFPNYELTDHAGKHRKLSDLQGPDPMILVLSRGGYCPKDRRQADGLVQLHHEMEVGYSRLVTISTDNMLLTNGYRDGGRQITRCRNADSCQHTSKASLVSLQSIPPGCDDEPPNASDEVSLGCIRQATKTDSCLAGMHRVRHR